MLTIQYDIIGEIVKPNYNGLIFNNSIELFELLKKIFFLKNSNLLKNLRKNMKETETWDEHWNSVMLPLLRKLKL